MSGLAPLEGIMNVGAEQRHLPSLGSEKTMPEPKERDLIRQGRGKEHRHGLSKAMGARRREAEMRVCGAR